MMRRLQESTDDRTAEINLSPLIDMVFILLIFFIVTTVFIEETGVELNKPEAASSRALEKKSVLLAVTADGKVVYGGKEIGVQGVRPHLQRIMEMETRPVILQVDEDARAGLAVRVLDEAKLAGASQVSVSTEPVKK